MRWARGANVPKGSASHAPDPRRARPDHEDARLLLAHRDDCRVQPKLDLGIGALGLGGEVRRFAPDFDHGSLGGKPRRQRKHLRFVGDSASPDILDRRHHAAVARERLVGERDEKAVRIGGRRGAAKRAGKL